MFEGFGWKKRNPMEKREVVKPEGAAEAPAVIARDALGNPIGTAHDSLEAEHKQAENAQEWREAA